MPSKRISRDLKTAIEGKEWVLKTTRNDILYTEMVDSLEQLYIPRDVYFTHEPHYRCNRCDIDECNDLAVVLFVFSMFLIFFSILFSQMLP